MKCQRYGGLMGFDLCEACLWLLFTQRLSFPLFGLNPAVCVEKQFPFSNNFWIPQHPW